MEIRINKLTIKHAQDVQRLSGQLGYPMSMPDIEANIAEVITTKDHIAFVALENEKAIGWIHAFKGLFLESRPFIEIGGLVVDEEHRGKGVGKELVQKIREWCLEKGFDTLRVRSNTKRNEAHRFYLNLGFTEMKEQKVFQIQL
jgi:GNAT superfamily N-acetyltransferase